LLSLELLADFSVLERPAPLLEERKRENEENKNERNKRLEEIKENKRRKRQSKSVPEIDVDERSITLPGLCPSAQCWCKNEKA
jgi:hypothetical protein